MKKSFLKRVAAAAIAVPVALTQTVLFTSFAEGETAKTKTISIDTFKAIKPDATRTVRVNADENAKYTAAEAKYEYAYVQESAWNEKLEVALDSLADGTTRSIDAVEVLDAVKSQNDVVKLIKASLDKEKTTATVTVKRGEVVVRVDAVIDVRAGIQEVADQNDVNMTFPDKGEYTGTMIMTADTTGLADKAVPFSVKLVGDDETKAFTMEELVTYVQDRFQEIQDYGYGECDKEEAEGNTDAPILRGKLDNIFGKFSATIANAQDYLESAKNKRTREYTAADVDDLYEQIRDEAANSRFASKTISYHGKEYSLESLPETIDDALDKNLYATAAKYFIKAINRANRTLAQKSYEIDVTDEEILAFLRSGYDFTVKGKSEDLIADATTTFYIPDEDFDEEFYVDFFEAEIEAGKITPPEGKVLVSAESVKYVDAEGYADGNVNDPEKGFPGLGFGNVYRVVWPVFDDEEITDSSESTEDSSESTEDSSESKPDESNPSEESNPTETKPEANPEDITIDVETDQAFYFSHDSFEFAPEDLIKDVTVEEGKDVEVDMEHFEYGITQDGAVEGLSPMNVYEYYYINRTADGYKYNVAKPVYIYYNNGDGAKPVKDKNGEQATAYVYIGVKGDCNLDGEANASDAADVLMYAAAKGAGQTPVIYSDYNEILERFAFFLGDTNTEGVNGETEDEKLNASDAAEIQIFAALRGAKGDYYLDAQGNETTADAADAVPFAKVNWIDEINDDNGVLSPEYPEYSLKIAKNAGLVK